MSLALASLAMCLAFVMTDGTARGLVLAVSSAVPTVVVVALLTLGRVRRTVPWWLLAAGLAALTVNCLTWSSDVGRLGTPAGTLEDASLLLGYGLLLSASAGILAPLARRDGGALLEAAALWVAGASILWSLVVNPALIRADAAPGTRLYTLVVALVLSAVAGQVLRAAVSNRAARPALVYLTSAIVLALAGNVLTVVTPTTDSPDPAWWIGLVWVCAFGALASAAVHPSHVALTEPPAPAPAPARLSMARLVLFGLALGLNPAIAGAQQALDHEVDWMLLVVASLAIVVLVVARIAHLTRRQTAAENALAYLATHDELTGLRNRRSAVQHLGDALDRVASGASPGLTLMFLDVDGLKAINDGLGHPAGDDVIRAVSRRLVETIRPGAFAARFGGDEFVVIDERPLEDVSGEVDVLRVALSGCHVIEGQPLPAGTSIGVRQVPAGTVVSVAEVVADADARMYADKRRRPAVT